MTTYYDITVIGTYADSTVGTLANIRINTDGADKSRAQYVQVIQDSIQSFHDDPDSGDANGLTNVAVNVQTVTV